MSHIKGNEYIFAFFARFIIFDDALVLSEKFIQQVDLIILIRKELFHPLVANIHFTQWICYEKKIII